MDSQYYLKIEMCSHQIRTDTNEISYETKTDDKQLPMRYYVGLIYIYINVLSPMH